MSGLVLVAEIDYDIFLGGYRIKEGSWLGLVGKHGNIVGLVVNFVSRFSYWRWNEVE